MVSTYTSNKGYLQKPAHNDFTDTWDVPVNGNFDEIDSAIGGNSTINLSAGNVTLSVAQARNAVLIFTGAPAANVVVTLPTNGLGSWIVQNLITTAFTVTVIGSGSTSVTLPVSSQGLCTFIWSDSVNVFLADSAPYLPTSGGTLTGGITLPINGLSVGGGQLVCTGGNVTMSGALTVAGNITGLSDRRVKSNIRAIDEALAIVNALEGVRYEDPNGRTQVGLIAQDVKEVLPEVVFQNSETGLYSLAYGNIVSVLIEAVKELSARVDELEVLK